MMLTVMSLLTVVLFVEILLCILMLQLFICCSDGDGFVADVVARDHGLTAMMLNMSLTLYLCLIIHASARNNVFLFHYYIIYYTSAHNNVFLHK